MVVAFTVAFVVALNLTAWIAARALALAAGWGALWGAALGIWFVGPALLTADRVRVGSAGEWTALTALLLAIFAVLGAALTLVGGAPAVLWVRWVNGGGTHRSRALLFGLVLPVCLVPAYVAGSALIELYVIATTSLPGVAAIDWRALATILATAAGALALSRQAARRIDSGGLARRVAAALASVALVGALALPYRGPDQPAREEAPAPAIAPSRTAAERSRLIVIGLDSGNWDTLAPLLERGRAPVLKSLVDAGVTGTVRASYPPYWSAPAWGSILTGYSREEVDVYEDLTIGSRIMPSAELRLAPNILLNPINVTRTLLAGAGLFEIAPHHREALRRSPVWEMLARAGVRTAVLRFPFTHPATGPADYVVSNRVDAEGWEMAGVRPGDQRLVVHPRQHAEALRRLFHDRREPAERLLERLGVPDDWSRPGDSKVDLQPLIASVMATDHATFEAARTLVETDPGLEVMMVYIGGFDVVCHAFWPYRFPEAYPVDPPAPSDVRRFSGVIDAYLEYLDGELGALIERFPDRPNVLIVSDHGHTSTYEATLWRGWHGPDGLFIAAGPDVSAQPAAVRVSYLDVVPTILDLLGLESGAALPGRSALLP